MNAEFAAAAMEVNRRATPAAWDSLCRLLQGAPVGTAADELLLQWAEATSPELRGAVRSLLSSAHGTPCDQVAACLRTVRHLDLASHWGATELLWTGPSGGDLTVRRMDQALYDLVATARERILIVSFSAAYVPILIGHLRVALDRGVKTTLILETEAESAGQLSFDAAAAFPEDIRRRCSIHTWPRNLREVNAAGKPGKLHVKCAVIDDSAIITSANLTDDAFNRNMELGVLCVRGAIPGKLFRHFQSLIRAGVLVPEA